LAGLLAVRLFPLGKGSTGASALLAGRKKEKEKKGVKRGSFEERK
jgi:hypothetical protein